jgi:hypothetical protein
MDLVSSMKSGDRARVRRTAQGLHGNRLYGSEGILSAVVQFIQQIPEVFFLLYMLGNIHE